MILLSNFLSIPSSKRKKKKASFTHFISTLKIVLQNLSLSYISIPSHCFLSLLCSTLSSSATMFDSAIELITQAASSSLFVFCLCNLIIAVILMGSKSSSTPHQDTTIPLSVVPKPETGDKERMKAQFPSKKHENSTPYVAGIGVSYATNNSDTEEKEGTMENHENNSPGSCEKDGQENNDALRKRVEEFIDKVNREWRAEQFRIVS